MPTPARFADFVATVEAGRYVEAIERFYAPHASMQENMGRSIIGRGALVVICSDGLDRGDPSVLGEAMQRLSRLAHRVIWLNPHKGDDPDFQPSTLGMLVAAPYVDALLSGHDLASLEELAELLPSFG